MMKNSHGLDVSYFESKLKLVVRDISNYAPDELARELARLSSTADQNVLAEKEFSGRTTDNKIERMADVLLALDALNFNAGDWHPESIERHLKEQIALARKHLQSIVDNEPPVRFAYLDKALITEQLMTLQALNNAHDGSTEVHDAIAALISKIDMPIAAQPSGSTEQLNIEKAKAIFNFVNIMIGALESGFVDNGNLTLAEAHQTARHHVKDEYGIDHPNIVAEWGQDVAELCGIKQPQEPANGSTDTAGGH